MKRKNRTFTLALVFIIAMAVVALTFSNVLPEYGLVTSGWEIYNQIAALEHNGVIYKSASQFTSPRELKGVYWKVDIDDPASGISTLMIEISDVRHVDFSGRDLPNDRTVDSILVTRGDRKYYLDYHIYLYTVTVRTVADKAQYVGIYPWTVPQWKHETSFPYEGWNSVLGGVGSKYVGKPFKGGVYTRFAISPWRGGTYREAPSADYVLENCWAGVMNTYVLRKQMGQIQNQWGKMPETDPQAAMWVKAALSEGNQVPMFTDDGAFGTPAPTIRWDSNAAPDSRISSTVVHYMPCEMLAGAHLTLDVLGIAMDMQPCDVYIQYTYRIDVLQVHGFALKTAVNPPQPKPPSDFFSWAESFWKSFMDGLSGWFGNPFNTFMLIVVIVIILLVLVTVLNPGVWSAVAVSRRHSH